jgi:membrane-bound serine protease (ClpP class)
MIQTLLDYLANPDLAFVLLTVGALLVLLELANPGLIIPGIAGGVAVVAGLLGLTSLPVSPPGLVLLVLAVSLFVLEVIAPSTGFFASFGVLAMIGAGMFLFQGEVSVSLGVLLPVTVVTGGGVAWAGHLAYKARTQPPSNGNLVGRKAEVRSVKDGIAQVVIDGTWWRVRSPEPLQVGQNVSVVNTEGLTLVVAPEHPAEHPERLAENPQHAAEDTEQRAENSEHPAENSG